MFSILKGVHVPHRKHTADMEAVRMPVPAAVTIPLSMHIGAPAAPAVAPGTHVDVGQLVGSASGYVSADVHSSVSGTVKAITDLLMPNGKKCSAVVIETDGAQTVSADLSVPEVTDRASFLRAVAQSGAVGLGGAGFPTAVKLNIGERTADTLIINGAECEPYITSDTRTMLERTEELCCGAELLEKYLSPARIVIAVEKNKPQCIEALRAAMPKHIEVLSLPSVYPQGGEKVLIYNVTRRIVPEGKLPLDVGAVVINVTTVCSIARYIKTGMPLTEKCVTVDGAAVAEPKNVIVPIGTSMQDVFDFCGGFVTEPEKVLYGGPMMGVAVADTSAPIMKSTNAIIAMSPAEAAVTDTTACIRCGACANHCPLRLDPRSFAHAYKMHDVQKLAKLKVNLCMECGCCAYVCPAKRPLVQTNRLAKAELAEYIKKNKEANK